MPQLHSTTDRQRLFQDLASGATLITVNKRLARHLLGAFEQQQIDRGAQVWPTPDILPLNAWLSRLHENLLDQGLVGERLLSPAQERVLWEDCIKASATDQPLMRPTAAAKAAGEAYRLLHQWQLGTDDIAGYGGHESDTFLDWLRAFDQRCRRHHVLSMALLPAVLGVHVRALAQDEAALWLAGFDEYPPVLATLLDALGAAGRQLNELTTPPPQTEPRKLAAADEDEERNLAARWALDRLQHDPQARIAIVCPDIQAQREPLRQSLLQTLDPTAALPGQAPTALPFNFSLGLPLAELPLSGDALLLLQLALRSLDLPELGRLLRSPYLGGEPAEADARVLLDVALRERGFPRHRLNGLLNLGKGIDPEAPHHCADLFERLQQVSDRVATLPGYARATDWADHLLALLYTCGWPGPRALSSREYQEAEAFQGLLKQLAGLDRVLGEIGPGDALKRLQQLAADNLFQPEGSSAPVQVLGVLEAAGLGFDHLWLMGLDDNRWPPSPTPNPLLPGPLQRQAGLPHSSPERELRYAREVTARLLAAAPEVIVSHPQQTLDGEQRPSPLIAAFAGITAEELGIPEGVDAVSPDTGGMQTVSDWQAPALTDKQAPGGTALLADQAACPFRAFAGHRLGIHPLEEASFGPDGRLIGSLIHHTLDKIWHRLKTQQALLETTADALHGLVAQAVDKALHDIGRQRPDLYQGPFRELEKQRLTGLMLEWLALETERPAFRIHKLEQREQIGLGPLQLKVRADRVDELADGRHVVIDYKTGARSSINSWTDERPSEPQVPLYCIQDSDPVAAAVIARVRSDDKAGFIGLADGDCAIPGVKAFAPTEALADWPALLDHWQRQLTLLAQEIQSGRADPTPSRNACEYCALPALCRVGFVEDTETEAADD